MGKADDQGESDRQTIETQICTSCRYEKPQAVFQNRYGKKFRWCIECREKRTQGHTRRERERAAARSALKAEAKRALSEYQQDPRPKSPPPTPSALAHLRRCSQCQRHLPSAEFDVKDAEQCRHCATGSDQQDQGEHGRRSSPDKLPAPVVRLPKKSSGGTSPRSRLRQLAPATPQPEDEIERPSSKPEQPPFKVLRDNDASVAPNAGTWPAASGMPLLFSPSAPQLVQQPPPGVLPMIYTPGPFFHSPIGYPMPIPQDARFNHLQAQPRMLPGAYMPPAPDAGFSPDVTEFEVPVIQDAGLDKTSDPTPTARGKTIGPVGKTAREAEHSQSKAKDVQQDEFYRPCDGDDEVLSAARCLLRLVDGIAEEGAPGIEERRRSGRVRSIQQSL